MKLPFALVIALCSVPGVALAAGGAGSEGASEKPASGFVSVACNPGCEGVFVDGRALGPSPVVRVELAAGTHKLTLRRKGYQEKRLTVSVKERETTSVSVKLSQQAAPPAEPPANIAARVEARRVKADGYVSLTCDPACDEVILDGKRKLGPAPHTSVSIPAGKHELTFKRKGAPDRKMSVVVAAGQTTALRIAMKTNEERAAPPAKPGQRR